ncbi:helix-turn-helix domain-containing protein [Fluviicola chungangensis]|uniref:Helix-turn-helix transcriptional regulator n=1 Tax=Fluviicola chungangensis TaxID=2597671 RepID=A0A556MN21_9FLAO|nr:helix-turn-helix transcriptional regulator [Fluviicola chungangensis]TSJ41285.1 helix-turn-helix transcriptional regulator [Fluviicola chungangensis]
MNEISEVNEAETGVNEVGIRIKKIREEKGISQEFLASCLNITQSNYGRLEKDDSRLSAPRLMIIAKVLKVSVSYLFGESASKIINQSNNETANAYNVETIINADKDHITTLKNEIDFLRGVLKEKLSSRD